MLTTYRNAFAAPGAKLFSATAALARLPLSMTGLGIVLLAATRTGSYGRAGTIAAVYVLVASVSGPLQGRLADRLGQAPVLWAAGALHAAGVVLAVAVIGDGGALPYLAVAVAGLGAPQAGNMVRARWAHVLDDRRLLSTAFAIEAVLDEAVFVVGPVLVTFLTLQVAETSGLLTAAGLSTAASWALAMQRTSEPPVPERSGSPPAPINAPLLWPLTVVSVGLGVLFGSTEVVVVAFTDEAGRDDLAGTILAVWAIGSLAAGLVVGALPTREPLRRLRWGLVGLTALFAPLGLLDGVVLLGLGMLAAGLMISPSLIALTRLVELGTPAQRFTEALGWVTTGLAAGVALGAAVVGRVIDSRGASPGFLVPLVAVAVAALTAWTVVPRLGVARPSTDYGGTRDD
jgi:MFS family permease